MNAGVILKLLFSVNCQTNVAFRAIDSFSFLHFWVCHRVNYIIPSYMWVRHKCKSAPSPVGPAISPLCDRSFRSFQNPDNSES